MRTTVLMVAFLAASPLMHSQEAPKPIRVPGGFLTGQEFLDMDKGNQAWLAMGLVDGVFLAPLFDAPDNGKTFNRIEVCVKDMSGVQIAAIIEKYLKDHPEFWNKQLNVMALNALVGVCPA
jgi:hypothetical protein